MTWGQKIDVRNKKKIDVVLFKVADSKILTDDIVLCLFVAADWE